MRTKLWSCALPQPPLPAGRVLRVVEALWAAMQADPENAGPILAEGLRRDRSLGAKERPIAGDMLTGMIRHARALARIDPDPVVAWKRLATEGPPDLDDPPDAYAVALSLPEAIAAEWWERLGPEAAIALAQRLAGRAPVALRALRGPVEIPVPHRWLGPHTVVLDGRANIHTFDAWRAGQLIVQDVGSQHIIDRIGVQPGQRVLDLCAGAGGKSLALAALGARVQAWDVRSHALAELKKRSVHAGLSVQIGPPKGRYDIVLVDAPCSGTGVLRRHPENRWKLRLPTDTQAALLTKARSLGDRVIYATCALTRAENEAIVGPTRWSETLWPGVDNEGFFVAEPVHRLTPNGNP